MIEFYRKPDRAPWWFAVILVLLGLPTVAFIPEAAHIMEDAEWLGEGYVGWVYPLCIVLCCVFAWLSYPERRTVAWILAGMVLLIDFGLLISVFLS